MICCWWFIGAFNLLFLIPLGKEQELTIDFKKILNFCLVRGFNLVLSLGVKTPLIIPVMDLSGPCILGKEWFDMLRNIGYGDFGRSFSSFSRYNRVSFD